MERGSRNQTRGGMDGIKRTASGATIPSDAAALNAASILDRTTVERDIDIYLI